MKNKDVKKIQLGGYSHYSYKDVRNKINSIDESDDFVGSFKSRKKKSNKDYCAKLKAQHNWQTVKYEFVPGKFYDRVICEACNKVDWFRTYNTNKEKKESLGL